MHMDGPGLRRTRQAVGDVNGDGFADIIVHGSHVTELGYRPPNGPTTTPSHCLTTAFSLRPHLMSERPLICAPRDRETPHRTRIQIRVAGRQGSQKARAERQQMNYTFPGRWA
jgi:hypothetical protein